MRARRRSGPAAVVAAAFLATACVAAPPASPTTSDGPAASTPASQAAATTPLTSGPGRASIDLGPPGTVIMVTERAAEDDPSDLEVDAVSVTGARRRIATLTDYLVPLGDAWTTAEHPVLAISDGGYLAVPLSGPDPNGDGSGGPPGIAVYDLGRPDAAPVVIEGRLGGFVGDDGLVIEQGRVVSVLFPGVARAAPVALPPDYDLVRSGEDLVRVSTNGRSLVGVHYTADGQADYGLVEPGAGFQPSGPTMPPLRLVTGDDRPTGAAGESLASFCSDGPTDSFCGTSVGRADGTSWMVRVEGDVTDSAWTIDGDRLFVLGSVPAMYGATPAGTERVVKFANGQNPHFVGLTRRTAIVALESDAGTRTVAVPLDGSPTTDLGAGTVIRVIAPEAEGS
jgi:hypothetical protein